MFDTHCSACGQPNPACFDGRFTDCCDEPPCAGIARMRFAFGDSDEDLRPLTACCQATAEEKTVGRGTLLRRVAAW